tara:strand:- start:1220 stop:1393 length:174 start_codon:yes stop_codon:yes gene_type:complete
MKWYEIRGNQPKVDTYSVVIENRCQKFFDGKKMYTGKIAHKKYIAWLLDNDLAKVVD